MWRFASLGIADRRKLVPPLTLSDGVEPRSLTHVHLARVLAAELSRTPCDGKTIRILDVGCGNGHLIDYVYSSLSEAFPGRSFEVFGLDVRDHGVQKRGFFDLAEDHLNTRHPKINWSEHLFLLDQNEPWPFPNNNFQFVMTNQVCEHLVDLDQFLAQVRRVLIPGGVSANVFPVRECVLEGHTGVPLAHRVDDHDSRAAYLGLAALLHVDRFGPLRRQADTTVAEYGESRSDYISFLTAYRSWTEIGQSARRYGFRVSHQYTSGLYWAKLGRVLDLDIDWGYSRARPLLNSALFQILKRLSSITMILELNNSYDAGSTHSSQ